MRYRYYQRLHDRVFIFAHELGHALHFALTKDVDVFPDGFDKFNELFGMRNLTLKEKQETFADPVAYAILGGVLKKHLPKEFNQRLLLLFMHCFKGLTDRVHI